MDKPCLVSFECRDALLTPSATVTPDAEEFRGVSYAAGGDAGAITLPNILAHYNPNVTGAATGHHPPVSCGLPGMSRVCTPHSDDDRLNAAISGSVAAALVGQARGGLNFLLRD